MSGHTRTVVATTFRAALGLAVCACAAPAPVVPSARVPQGTPIARDLVAGALDAMGGEARIRAIHDVHMKAVESWASVEASERPEPPWNLNYSQTEQWLDYQRAAWRQDATFASVSNGDDAWQPFSQIAADGVSAVARDGQLKPGAPVLLADAAEQLRYQPYRLLLAAEAATDLRSAGDELLAGQANQIVAFHDAGMPIRIWIDGRTRRLTAAEIVHTMPDDAFWRIRGDVRDRLVFSQWTLHASGVWFARQYDLIRAAIPYHTFIITSIETNVATPAVFAIPDDVRAAYQATARGPASVPAPGEKPIEELSPGVWFAGAGRNALLIAQPGGAALVDAPISDVYVARELEEAQHRFGKPAATVVLTDHITPTLSGVREAAARGLAIRVLDGNRGFVAGLLAAPYTLAPDALARSGRTPKLEALEAIATRTVLGDGPTRMELIPMRGTLGERVLLVWLPAPRLLWVGSAITVGSDGHISPSRRAELDAVIAREHLDVDRVVGAKLAPASWASLRATPPDAARH